jgi:release factor glutamine methyltransferase
MTSETVRHLFATDVTGETGWRFVQFAELEIAYARSVLPPRPWTVAQSQWAVELLEDLPDGPILELCTGSGQIGLLAARRSGRDLVAVDVNNAAVACTRHNAISAGIAERVDIRCASLESALREHERFPLVIADPPWVPHHDVRRFPMDPPQAIDGGPDGLRLALRCLDVMEQHLQGGGVGLLQLGGAAQVHQVRRHLAARQMGLEVSDVRSFPGHGELVRLDQCARGNGR